MTSGTGWVLCVAGATIVAWAGFFAHNTADLPGQSILSPESLLPTLIWVGILALWLIPVTRPIGAWALLVWAVINAVGGVLSVLPLEFLPFEPAQTPQHYGAHGLYLAAQLPLIVLLSVWLRRDARARTAGAGGGSAR